MTLKKLAIAMAATAAILTPASIASAQGVGRGPVASACAPEIARYCAGKTHGYGAVRACLEVHRQRVSGQCRYALGHTGYGWRWR